MAEKKFKILCTGNPNRQGLQSSILKEFPETTFVSLSLGCDLTSSEGQLKFRKIIKDYNVFINVSHIATGVQETLLKITHDEWTEGHVFNIGSIAEYKKWEWYDINYTKEKRQLRETSLELLSKKFKTTHVIVGGFQDYSDDNIDRMDPDEIVKIIKYILHCPVNIPIVGIEKISDTEIKE